ncbi:MAG TPA: ATP-dependent DNA helicase RecG, partial [Pirellulales bacterium]|nr:ATP-dependent DNA helicase RecG [Pirellulales bacterium]
MSHGEKTAAEALATPAQFIKGVGPQRAELLERLGLYTARDLLFFFPRDYQDLSELQTIAQLEQGALVRMRGVVAEIDQRTSMSGTIILGVLLRAAEGCVRLLWFNQAYMRQRFALGHELLVTGKPKLNGGVWEFVHPQVQWLEAEDGQSGGKLLPVYPRTDGLNQGQMRRI